MKQRSDSSRCGVIIYDGVEPIDVGGTAGVISMAKRVLPGISSVMIAERAGPVRLAGDVTVIADFDFRTAPACDQYIVCGGPGWRDQVKNAAMLDFIGSHRRDHVASVCTGALILAAAGTLDGLAATTRRRAVGQETQSPLALLNTVGAAVSPHACLVAEDRGVVTSGGVSLAIDGTLYLIGRLYGAQARDEVADVIEYSRAFDANRRALGIYGDTTAE